MDNWIYVLRILIALLLGFAIGFERKLRLKEAGIRTHSIVAAGFHHLRMLIKQC